MYFRQIEDPYLAQYAYLIGCQASGEALLIDPERDVERYLEIAAAAGLRIAAVAETHIHADFVSGSPELARRLPVDVYLSAEGGPDWQYQWTPDARSRLRLVKHGDRFSIGKIEVEVVHTPGHTPEHLCYSITDHGGGAIEAMGLISGDFVFVGDVGRPDLLESAAGQAGAKEPAARALYQSLVKFLDLPDYLKLWPGHGAGSVCGKALGAVPDTTVGYERRCNPALRAARSGEERFVREILHGQPEPPLYFAQMKSWNKQGPPLLPDDLRLPELAMPDVAARATDPQVVVVDTRTRVEYVAGHLPGALWIPLSTSFPTYAGSFITPEQAVIVVCSTEHSALVARLLRSVGLDRILGCVATQDYRDWLSSHETRAQQTISYAELAKRHGEFFILDVRSETEFAEGCLPGAVCIPHPRILTRLADLPRDRRIAVYCSAASRSGAVVSLLRRLGYQALANDEDITLAATLLSRAGSPVNSAERGLSA